MEEFIRVTEENLAIAATVHAAAWQESHRMICSEAFVALHTQQRQAAYLRNEMAQGKRIWLLKAEGEPVGLVSVLGSLIENLYVAPEKQRRGYGTKLLDHAVMQCEDTPTLWILSSNAGTERFYTCCGFVRTGRCKQLSDTLSEIEMACRR